jgi:flagellar motor protein MotB
MTYYNYLELNSAETLFLEAIDKDPRFYEAHMMLGELYYKQNKFKAAAKYYLNAINIDSNEYRPAFFTLAESEFKSGDYHNALKHYQSYLRSKNISENNKKIAARNIENSLFAIEAMKNPVPFSPESVGSGVNSADDEYWPSITADGSTMMFTRQLFSETRLPVRSMAQEDFFLSEVTDSGWSRAINAGAPLNTSSNEGAQTLSADGSYMFFTACDRPGGLGSCDIYFSAYNNGKWTKPYNVGEPINSRFWESTPSINANGDMIFFSSNRPGGFGGKDLWYSIMDSAGQWTEPVNMGNRINTEYDETSPFIHFDGTTLYFASDGWPGMGGLDLFITRMNEDSTWTEPKNLGYPINTAGDEMGLVIEAGGEVAYFSSKRENSLGKDIYSFVLDESIRPNPVSYIKGKVSDKETGRALRSEFELINLTVNETVLKSNTDENGNFLICLPSGYNYGINISKPGYLFFSESFMFEGGYTVSEPLVKNVYLQIIKVGETMSLKNVFFAFDSWELKAESTRELDNLVKLLIQNPTVKIEIGGHTDIIGAEGYNQTLSEKRALAVVDYIISKGIKLERLSYKGYGNSMPIGDNSTEEGRELNRRTEVKILGM